MHCELRTAEKTLFSGEATIVVAKSPRGEFGVMDGHAPLLAVLAPSPLRIKTKERELKFALSSGLLRVGEGEVRILAQEAIPAEEIDIPGVRARISQLADTSDSEGELSFLRVQERMGGKDV